MALINCPECEEEISNEAAACPYCGYPIKPPPPPQPVVVQQQVRRPGFEWRSKACVGRWPLVHVAIGWNPETGRLHVARGVIAIGQFGVGLITIAQFGVGLLFGLGQFVAAPFVVAQFALALVFAFGQVAIGLVAIGQLGFGYYVRAAAGYGRYVWSSAIQDGEAIDFFRGLGDALDRMLGR